MAFFTDEQLDTLSASTVRLDLLVKMDFKSKSVYAWNGNYELDHNGKTWIPFYGAMTIDGLSMPTGTTSEQVTFELNGLPDQATDLLGLALQDTPDTDQQLVTIYVQLFGNDWQPVGAPIGLWWGFMQPPRVSRGQMHDDIGTVQSISMTAENAFFNRSRPAYGRYTDRDQQRRSPGDKFFQFTPSLLFKTFTYPDY